MDLLATPRRRKVLFAALYASEGAPIGFLWWALPTRLKASGVPVEQVATLVGMLVLPWAFKFLWAPLVDVLRSPRWPLRAWVLSTQFVMGLALVPLLWMDLEADFRWIVVLLWVHALAAATQDASIDALAIAHCPPEERGSLNGWMQVGMISARAAFGGGALMLASELGTRPVIVALIAVIWASSMLVLMSRELSGVEPRTQDDALARFVAALRSMLSHSTTWLGLGLAILAGTAFESVGAVAGPFLIERGFREQTIGVFFLIFPMAGALLGVAGGYVSDRVGRRSAVAVFVILTVVCVWAVAAIDAAAPPGSPAARVVPLAAMYLGIGLLTAASYALFMDLTDPRLGATQFSAFMGATNLCESASAMAVGRLIPAVGYPVAFASLSMVSLLALPILWLLPPAAKVDAAR